jgi:hypothetical protein
MNKYNTQLPDVILKEYGRNIQKLVEYVVSIEDKEARTKYAHTLVELMRQINPNMKEGAEYTQKLWDDLYIMSYFKLDVDSPYPLPEKDILGKKPKRLGYNKEEVRFKHYGKNIELLVRKAVDMEEEEKKEAAVIYIAKLMKSFYTTWNKENSDDSLIIHNIKELSKNKLSVDFDKLKENNSFDISNLKERTEKPERERDRDRTLDKRNIKSKRPINTGKRRKS